MIDVKAVAAHKGNEVRGQFDNGADANVTNLFVYLHDYKPYNRKFKCLVWLTGAVGFSIIYPLGEGRLLVPAPVPCGCLAI